VRKRSVVLLVTGLVLAAPASASAHGRAATVALDYRLVLHRSSTELPGVTASILDGDRSLKLELSRGALVVQGDLGEPMVRLTTKGAWANRASATAVAAKLVTAGRGWKQVGTGPSFAWHEHRLAPPPYDGGKAGPVASFVIPATLNGRRVTIDGTFVRYARPPIWPWVLGAGVIAAALAGMLRVRAELRGQLTTVLGSLAGLAGLGMLVVFGAKDAPNGRVAWAQIIGAAVLAAVASGALLRLKGSRRIQLAGLLGLAAVVVSLSYLSVFWHGVVISLLSATATRSLLLTGLIAGGVAAVTSLTAESAA
jgi:hypothetical protein